MTINSDIPLIHASVCQPIIQAAEAIGSPLDKIFNQVNLTTEAIYNPSIFIPEIPCCKLVNAISQLEGIPLFGLQAPLEIAMQDWESVKQLTQGCYNLKSLLERFCKIVPLISNVSSYILVEDNHVVWLKYNGRSLLTDSLQIELFDIAGMIQLVQLVAGSQWRPDEIHIPSDYNPHVDNAEQLNPSKILFNQVYPAIAIPRTLLPFTLPSQESIDPDFQIQKPSQNLKESFLTAITPYIGHQKITTALLCEISGMSIRTFQRKLSDENTGYYEIIEQARLQKAKYLLTESDEKLIDISLQLGYKNSSTFSRSYKRWCGVTPLEYRNHFHKSITSTV